jgi:hypothetical protein
VADTPRASGPEGDGPTPRWVYAVGIILILLALGFVAMHFASGGISTH